MKSPQEETPLLAGFQSPGKSLALKKVLESLPEGRGIAILTQDNPDPDAIGAALGVQRLCSGLRQDLRATIYYGGHISHPQNQTMVSVLGINLKMMTAFKEAEQDFVILVDASNTGKKNIQSTAVQPDVVFDHHEDRPDGEPRFVDIREVGSTCTLITEHLVHLDIQVGPNLATALLFGLSNDTDHMTSANTTPLDFTAFQFLQPKVDKAILNEIENFPLPTYIFELEQRATEAKRVKGSTLVAGLGYLEGSKRDGIPYVADRFLRLEEIDTVVIHAIVGDRIHSSFRTTNERIDANEFVQNVFGAEHAGAKKGEGGAQVPLGWLAPREDLDEGSRNLIKRYVTELVARRVFQFQQDEEEQTNGNGKS
ncbi:bifunctional oligoribonuclease/PAP phosphatase NrnA [Acidimicrobium ferrooxidans]|nr:bifunctional oligoribonuclease/PAP phosphatase NrnA [Acidimicrobium ferrooxidans]